MRAKNKKARLPKPPHCPECGASSVIPVVHGIPDANMRRAIAEGKAILANREEWEGLTEWYCKQCGCDWNDQWRRFKKPGSVNATR
jgi:hypothetical protein